MIRRIITRAISIILTLILVSLLVYALEWHSLGDGSSILLSEEASQEAIERFRAANDVGGSFFSGYFKYLKSFFMLDWGRSLSGASIKETILYRLPVTFALSLLSMAIVLLISIPWSIVASYRRRWSSAVDIYSMVIMSMPSFLVALVLVIIFSIKGGLFPVAGYTPVKDGFFSHIRTLFLPSLTSAIIFSPLFLRLFRAELMRNSEAAFSESFRAQGATEKEVVILSALKPSLAMFISLSFQAFASFLAGSAVVETVFALPGLGSLLVSSALNRDSQLAGILALIIALMISLTSFAAEVISFLVDPRLREEKR